MSFINKGTPNEGTPNVSEADVIEFYAKLFKESTKDAIKAAEFFAKYYNMLDKDPDSGGTVIIVDDIGGAADG